MSKTIKDLVKNAYAQEMSELEDACVIDLSGLDAINTNRVRGELKKQNIYLRVVKNSLLQRAVAGKPLEALAKSLNGPCAIVYGDPSVTDIAKELVKWADEHDVITLKDGIIEGDPELVPVTEMARMKGKRELVGEIGMLISSPGRNIASAISSPAGKIAGCLKAIVEKAEAA